MTHSGDPDEVRLRTVGVDIGSTTSHLVFSTVVLRRVEATLSSRFVVVSRTVTWESPILLTPYAGVDTIDSAALLSFLDGQYAAAGVTPESIDTGAVILTGNALLRKNSRPVAEIMSSHAGRLVCAAAGHDLEARLAALGSGAVARSDATRRRIVNVDIGGGTTKFALIADGELIDTAVLAVGARLVTWDNTRTVTAVHDSIASALADTGTLPHVGAHISSDVETLIATELARLISEFADHQKVSRPDALLIAPQLEAWEIDEFTFSGGVSEYLVSRDRTSFQDLGIALADQLRDRFDRDLGRVSTAGEHIRATVVGAGQHSAQVSGSTIFIGEPAVLPLHAVPVVRVRLAPVANAAEVERAITDAVRRGPQLTAGTTPALAISWPDRPEHHRLRALAEGIAAARATSLRGAEVEPARSRRTEPLVLVFDRDLASTMGRLLTDEVGITGSVLCVDGAVVSDYDFMDIGEVIEPAGAVPLVIRSLLFPSTTVDRPLRDNTKE